MCDWEPLTSVLLEPSPHRTEYVPLIGRIMSLSESLTVQVVIKAAPGHRTEYVPLIGRIMSLSESLTVQVVIKAAPAPSR